MITPTKIVCQMCGKNLHEDIYNSCWNCYLYTNKGIDTDEVKNIVKSKLNEKKQKTVIVYTRPKNIKRKDLKISSSKKYQKNIKENKKNN